MWQTHVLLFILSSLPPISKNVILFCHALAKDSYKYYLNSFPNAYAQLHFRHPKLCSELVTKDLKTQFKAVETANGSPGFLSGFLFLLHPKRGLSLLCYALKEAFSTGYLGHDLDWTFFYFRSIFFPKFSVQTCPQKQLIDLIFWRFSHLQGKCSASSKDSSLFGVSLSELVKADLSSSALRCQVVCNNVNYFFLRRERVFFMIHCFSDS